MLNTIRRHLAALDDAHRAASAARHQLHRLVVAPGVCSRVDRRHVRRVGHLVTITAWWEHPVTGARWHATDTVPAASGPAAAERAAVRVMEDLHHQLRADRSEADA